jgi:hypothetical protein
LDDSLGLQAWIIIGVSIDEDNTIIVRCEDHSDEDAASASIRLRELFSSELHRRARGACTRLGTVQEKYPTFELAGHRHEPVSVNVLALSFRRGA